VPRAGYPPLTEFHAFLVRNGLSPASAATYVKHLRRVLNAIGGIPETAEQLARYDEDLSVAMRDGFRAAWAHFVEFGRSQQRAFPPAPSKATRRRLAEGPPAQVE
jgi:hypothetical protein